MAVVGSRIAVTAYCCTRQNELSLPVDIANCMREQ